jgi:hypothetical protein
VRTRPLRKSAQRMQPLRSAQSLNVSCLRKSFRVLYCGWSSGAQGSAFSEMTGSLSVSNFRACEDLGQFRQYSLARQRFKRAVMRQVLADAHSKPVAIRASWCESCAWVPFLPAQ